MAEVNRESCEIRIGSWTLRPELNRLEGTRGTVRLEPRAVDVLVELARDPGRVVSRADLRARVWGDVHVSEDALNRVVSLARRALGDDPQHSDYIETVPKRGYRLVAPVEPVRRRPQPTAGRLGWAGAVLVVAAAAVAAHLWQTLPGGDEFEVRPLTTFPGEERSPALSPDGRRLAFLWNGGSGSSFELYVKPVDREAPRRLTRDGAPKSPPVWSPDGHRLGFGRRTRTGAEICLVPVEGGAGPNCIASLNSDRVPRLDWAPAGATLAVSERAETDGPYALVAFDLVTGDRTALTRPLRGSQGDRLPAFSADGSLLLFVRAEAPFRADLHVLDVASGRIRQLTFDRRNITGADWDVAHPDRIVFTSNRDGVYELWEVSVTGTPARRLIDSESRAFDVASFPGGDRFAYAQWEVDANVWRIEGSTGRQMPAVVSSRQEGAPAVSPDGNQLAFVSDRSGDLQLWVSRIDGSEPRRLTHLSGESPAGPKWAPDGQALIFEVREAAGYRIEWIGLEGRSKTLVGGLSRRPAPSWSSDGKYFYFCSDRAGESVILRQGADPAATARMVGPGSAAAEDPSGRFLYSSGRNRVGLWRRPVTGGAPEITVSDLRAEDWDNWDVTETAIWYVGAGEDGSRSIKRFDLRTGRRSVVADASRVPYSSGLTVSSQGDIYVVRIDRSESDLMMMVRR